MMDTSFPRQKVPLGQSFTHNNLPIGVGLMATFQAQALPQTQPLMDWTTMDTLFALAIGRKRYSLGLRLAALRVDQYLATATIH
jgi:hypothetical protein